MAINGEAKTESTNVVTKTESTNGETKTESTNGEQVSRHQEVGHKSLLQSDALYQVYMVLIL